MSGYISSFWLLGIYTEVTYLSADVKVVSENTVDRSLVATSQCWLSGHPSKYWALLDFGDRRNHAPTVQLPVLV